MVVLLRVRKNDEIAGEFRGAIYIYIYCRHDLAPFPDKTLADFHSIEPNLWPRGLAALKHTTHRT